MKFIPIAKPIFGKDELRYVNQCIRTGWISSQGKLVKRFEQKFAQYCKVKYGIATSNGTAALHLALLGLGIGPGDEVIVPDLTFIAPVNSVIYTGARPVLVDIDRNTFNIDVSQIEKNITKKTKAIIVVHLYGRPCLMDEILNIAKKYNLFIIEDCAESHGAEYKGRKVGSFGHISCFSFFANKIITTGEGGMCLTNNKRLAKKINILLNHGMSPKKRYWHNIVGFNYRLTNIQAGIGLAQLRKIDKFLKEREKIGKLYNNYLKDISGIEIPSFKKWEKPVYWLYSILIDKKYNREKLIEKLKQKNIETRPFFYPVHKMPFYKKYIKKGQKFPIAEEISKRGISLPTFVNLTSSQIQYICNSIRKLLKKQNEGK